ncbi:MAG: hypothetical protein EON54_08465 [Alcaligenaceae bacterium]|nr:MAG: hypothetical protein EON54_08465 [Alcaligenaceae bacterium]
MNEIIDDIALRWALRDIVAKRYRFTKVSDAMIQRLRELEWIEERDGELFASDIGLAALP